MCFKHYFLSLNCLAHSVSIAVAKQLSVKQMSANSPRHFSIPRWETVLLEEGEKNSRMSLGCRQVYLERFTALHQGGDQFNEVGMVASK